MPTVEKVSSILPRVELAQASRIEELSREAHAARDAYDVAQRAIAVLTEQEGELLREVIAATLDMQRAKMRVDAALKEVRQLTGYLP